MASSELSKSDPCYLAELERQLENRDESLKKLKQILAEKDDLLLATAEKLCEAEKRKTELETTILAPNLNTPEVEPEDTFVSGNFRLARLEMENNALKSGLAEMVSKVGKCVDGPESESEDRLRDLNRFGLGILSSFGLSALHQNPSSFCDSFSVNGSIDHEG